MTSNSEELHPLLAVMEPVRRALRAQERDPELVEDVLQETLVRVAAVQDRLSGPELEAYAVTTARNTLINSYRRQHRHQRNVHRLVEYSSFTGPEEAVLEEEESEALAVALDCLPDDDRRLLLAHEVDGATTAQLAERHGSTPAAVAMRLSRARSTLRLEFLLAYRNTALPSGDCRPVLMALSLRDKRRQATLDTGSHLRQCDTCRALADPLVHRQRRLAAWGAFGLAVAGIGTWLRRALTKRPAQVGLAAITAVAAVTLAFALTRPSGTRPPVAGAPVPAPTSSATGAPAATASAPAPSSAAPPGAAVLSVDGQAILPIGPNGLKPYLGRAVVGRSVTIIAVPADEGFWVGTDPQNRVWVELVPSKESPQHYQPGMRLDLDGTMIGSGSLPAGAAGDTTRDAIERQGAYIAASTTPRVVS